MNRIFLSEESLKSLKNSSIEDILKKFSRYNSIVTLDAFSSRFLELRESGDFTEMKAMLCS